MPENWEFVKWVVSG